MARQQAWLTLPQVVVLEATRDLDLVFQVTGSNPDLLSIKANQILGMLAYVPIEAEASDEQRRDALRQLRQEKLPGERESRYLVAQQRVAGLLAGGVPVKVS